MEYSDLNPVFDILREKFYDYSEGIAPVGIASFAEDTYYKRVEIDDAFDRRWDDEIEEEEFGHVKVACITFDGTSYTWEVYTWYGYTLKSKEGIEILCKMINDEKCLPTVSFSISDFNETFNVGKHEQLDTVSIFGGDTKFSFIPEELCKRHKVEEIFHKIINTAQAEKVQEAENAHVGKKKKKKEKPRRK